MTAPATPPHAATTDPGTASAAVASAQPAAPASSGRPAAAAASGRPTAAVGELFARFFDDAALFPPGNATMAEAVPAFLRRHGTLVGPFVLPASRLAEVDVHLDRSGPPLDLALIASPADLPAAAGTIAKHPGLRLATVEATVAVDAAHLRLTVRTAAGCLPPDLPVAVEIPRTDARDEVLDALAGTGFRAKLRTGGVRADLFPPVAELAATIRACVDRGIAFKCTAGLHHAIRHTDPATGFDHHGFLNVLLAADEPSRAAEHLARTDAAAIATELRTWSPARAARARAVFTSFGTCDVGDPIHDLVQLGLLPERITV
ncbi:hypothetical protein GCM10010168_57400 [Actinoplanes ianthinogenes]|uniref:Uncharacterized protein n=1 Tax=Actinoplanes ianthinogenes TaxID=122358 RepID=A0ABN6CLF2_9ACTN|nr:hypothetical protein [Actinoplanes ianthinogenes]BCJ45840.1 hypothetical protein Aiant_64970 [Actinoplanes ianthinogenes]GGR31657.1 hypothetical protein GCM10010168_57400 [Actinoplanes ianthinogenes]